MESIRRMIGAVRRSSKVLKAKKKKKKKVKMRYSKKVMLCMYHQWNADRMLKLN